MLSIRVFAPLLALALNGAVRTADQLVLRDNQIVGTWECGPTTMHGPSFDLVVTTRTTNLADHTSTTVTTSVITPHGASPMTNIDESTETWSVDGDIITTVVKSARFVSSTDPTLKIEEGQAILDAQLQKKATYQSRVLGIDGDTIRSIPHNSMYKEAVVESICKRVSAGSDHQ